MMYLTETTFARYPEALKLERLVEAPNRRDAAASACAYWQEHWSGELPKTESYINVRLVDPATGSVGNPCPTLLQPFPYDGDAQERVLAEWRRQFPCI
jgi:hypothetical protein